MIRPAVPLPLEIAWRFLRGRRSRLLSGTARAALASIALGVTAMVIAMALMTGYREDLQRKLIGGNAAIVAYPLGAAEPPAEPAELVAELAALPGVVAVGRVAYVQGALSSPAVPEGLEVTVRGVEPGDPAGGLMDTGGQDLSGGPERLPGVLLGNDLADRLEVSAGDRIRLVALGFAERTPRFRYRSLEVRGRFSAGLAEFDASWAVADRELVEELSGLGPAAALYELAVDDPAASGAVAEAVRGVLGADFLVSDWRDLNRELFTALEVQQIALFFVLGLIVLVSTFNLASTLVVLVRERLRAVGALQALGLDAGRVRAVFLLYGAILGAAGTALGVAAGAGISWLITEFELIRFDPEVAAIYFVRSVPFRVRLVDVAAIVAFTLGVTLVACWLPAGRAARVGPAEALRYE